jgi:peptide deformylase
VARALDPARDHDRARRVAADLLATMRASPGCVGIAAPQIGEPVRMFAVDVTGHRKATAVHGELVLINPTVTLADESEVAREGCLSLPDLTANVRRARAVEVNALDPRGQPVSFTTEGFEARCLQHELDHLDGLLFLDRVDSLVDDVFRRKPRSATRGPMPGAVTGDDPVDDQEKQ